MARRGGIQLGVFFEERGVVAEVDAQMPFLLVGSFVEQRAEGSHPDQTRLAHPTRIEVLRSIELPQSPGDLELVGIVFVEQLESFFDGELGLRAALAVSVDPLKDGRLAPVDRPYCDRVDARLAAVRGKRSQNRSQFVRKRSNAQIGVPQA